MRFSKILFVFIFAVFVQFLFSQEALKSTEEEYYDFLSLIGITERPTLNYRTLSDSEWNIKSESKDKNTEESVSEAVLEKSDSDINSENELSSETKTLVHPWQNNNLGTKFTLWEKQEKSENWFMCGINQDIKLKIYGPEWFNSYNTAAPYGQNDGALWQGKGYNTSLTAGARLEAYGFELTVKPQVSFSQNLEFDIMPSAYDSEYGYFWGYGNNQGADAPQRFGDSAFWTYDWGDTEARWSWHTFTVGFGFQSPWLGPAWLNPMLGSNNAPTYPKLDIGLRKTQIRLPWLGWYIGDIEGRVWIGYLTESDYFDEDSSNDHNMIHGFSFAYSPSFLKGLTIGVNRICLVKWDLENLKYVLPKHENTHVGEQGAGEDQKFSLTLNYLFPSIGFEIYGEIGTDDYAPGGGTNGYMRYLTHTMIYTVGAKKSMTFSKEKQIRGEIIFEWNNTEMSQNYQLSGGYSFGFHYQITQGYTNKGQWLGSGIGYGGNSQHLEYRLYYPKGKSSLILGRNNPDNNFIYSKAINTNTSETANKYGHAFKANFYFGGSTTYFVTKDFSVSAEFLYDRIINPTYNVRDENGNTIGDNLLDNFHIELGAKFNI